MAAFIRGHWQVFAITAIVFVLWQTPVVVPLKILIVFLHELAHGIAAIVTGGEIISLSISPQQGGEVWTRGGNRFLTLSAGYLGSLVLGLGLLIVALRTHLDRIVLGGFGMVMLAVAALYVRDIFALGFCVLSGGAMLAAARFLPLVGADLILRVIGLASILYVPYDIFDDTLRRSDLRSDARMLAEEVGGATLIWGGLWLAVSLAVIWIALRRGLGPDSNLVDWPGRQ